MSVKSGLLAVDREALLHRARAAGTLASRVPTVELSATEIFAAYAGFDGLAWPDGAPAATKVLDGLVAPTMLPLVREYVAAGSGSKTDVVLLTWIDSNIDAPALQPGWLYAGIDVGYYESEFSHYSIVLHEVIFGIHATLRGFGRVLNRHLLLQNVSDAQAMLKVRQDLVDRNADLEEVDDLQIVHVAIPPDISKRTK